MTMTVECWEEREKKKNDLMKGQQERHFGGGGT